MIDYSIIRSKKRKKHLAIKSRMGEVEILAPYRMTDDQIELIVRPFLQKLASKVKKSDKELFEYAEKLRIKYLPHSPKILSISYNKLQKNKWGSCITAKSEIRLNPLLKGMPTFVLDYVILHEIAHLIEPSHDKNFWKLLDGFPDTQKAIGYLMRAAEDKIS